MEVGTIVWGLEPTILVSTKNCIGGFPAWALGLKPSRELLPTPCFDVEEMRSRNNAVKESRRCS